MTKNEMYLELWRQNPNLTQFSCHCIIEEWIAKFGLAVVENMVKTGCRL